MPYNERGEEVLDQTPIALPVGFTRPKPLNERIAEIAAAEMRAMRALDQGEETPEEADDFDVDDETYDRTTPWQERPGVPDPFALTREVEIRAGQVVEDLNLLDEKIDNARKIIDKYKVKKYFKKKPKAEPRESEDNEDDDSKQ